MAMAAAAQAELVDARRVCALIDHRGCGIMHGPRQHRHRIVPAPSTCLVLMLEEPTFSVDAEDMNNYFLTLSRLLCQLEVTNAAGQSRCLSQAVNEIVQRARAAHTAGNKLIFVGNGGSAAIASHMAADYSKNGNVRALAFNDASMLTCLGNDLGYDRVFAKQIEIHARSGDIFVAISSSGRSPNIINAVAAAANAGCGVLTLSGFTRDNPLRKLGEFNFFIDSDRYAFVEIGHLTICHSILDILCGLPSLGRSTF
jgi:D-sedoheptulose 7-phosphate isomerase